METSVSNNIERRLADVWNYPVFVNTSFKATGTWSFDVETDEQDNFVGIAFFNGEVAYYFTSLLLLPNLSEVSLIAHNAKGDMRWLKGWGVNVSSAQMWFDTALASYVVNATRDSHSLKVLAKDLLGLEWTTYKQMVHPDPEHPTKKVTLDKQPVEKVAAYCVADSIATFGLYEYFVNSHPMTGREQDIFDNIEMPLSRILLEMELTGALVDVDYLKELDTKFATEMAELRPKIPVDNPNSNNQVAKWLTAYGAKLPLTKKKNFKVDKATLQGLTRIAGVPELLRYNQIEKLKSTYSSGLIEAQRNGRVHCTFNQITRDEKGNAVGISTTRLSSSNPNLQNIPTRSDEGKLIKRAFIASPDSQLIEFDFSQIEPRLVAHFSQDPFFLRAFREDRDIYSELVEGTGRDRQDGKTFMLALLYGAQPEKLASVFKCSAREATQILNKMWTKIPRVKAWRVRTIFAARRDKGVRTLHGRFIPIPDIMSRNKWARLHAERVAVNATIQGSAAEIMKLAIIACDQYRPSITVHDSLLLDVVNADVDDVIVSVKKTMETIVKISVPLRADVKVGLNWGDAVKREIK